VKTINRSCSWNFRNINTTLKLN